VRPRHTHQIPGCTAQDAGLLGGCSEADLARLAAIARRREVAPGDVIHDQGSVALAAYLMVAGTADVLVAGRPTGSLDPGALFGHADVLSRRPYGSTVIARTPVSVWEVDGPRLDELLTTTPTLVRAVLRDLSDRVRWIDTRAEHGSWSPLTTDITPLTTDIAPLTTDITPLTTDIARLTA
jgi:CRP-like cAMP-binding protein